MNRMTQTFLLGSFAAFALFACQAETHPAPQLANTSVHGKPGAPVSVQAELGRSSARLTVAFDAAVEDVTVHVRGVDGLVVTSAPLLVEGGAFARGETRTFDVRFTPGPDRSHLVASVSVSQGGLARARVVSFAVGEPSTARTSVATSSTEGGEGGERVRLMRASEP